MAAAQGPSRDLSTYVIFASDLFRTKGFTLAGGNVGVNDGAMIIGGAVDAPSSELVADAVIFAGHVPPSTCAALFANNPDLGDHPLCGPAQPFASPIISGDLGAACGFPDPFPTCDHAAPVRLQAGETVVLPAGVYGDVVVRGGGGRDGILVLTGGDYVFCSLRTYRGAQVLFEASTELDVAGDIFLGPQSYTGPAAGSGLSAADISVYASGRRVKASRASRVEALLCAPEATLRVAQSSVLSGQFLARAIITERIFVPVNSTTTTVLSSTSTSTTSTTSTTIAAPTTTSTTIAAPTTTSTSVVAPTTTSTSVVAPTTTSTSVVAPTTTSTSVVAPTTTSTSVVAPTTTSTSVVAPSTTSTSVVAPTTTSTSVVAPTTTSTSVVAPTTTSTSVVAPSTTSTSVVAPSTTSTSTPALTTTSTSTPETTTTSSTSTTSTTAVPGSTTTSTLDIACEDPVLLGTADTFAVLAGSTVTNTNITLIEGDLGVSPGTAITGFPPGAVTGTIHSADGVADQAKLDLITAYDDAAGRAGGAAMDADIGGETLTPGVYTSASAVGISSGDLTLDAGGDASKTFIFQIGSTLITDAGRQIILTGGAQAKCIFWQVGSSATLGTNSVFKGTIVALTSISVTTGTNVEGRVLARNGAVTLDQNNVTIP